MADYQKLIAKLSLDQKIALLSGRDFWHTVPIPEIGLEAIRVSDGPSGVRGESFDERRPSISLPSASALSASWDEDLAERYGEVAASEAIDKQVQVILGPTINLHRSPLGGRHFEAYSEDPLLTGKIASAFVRGVQSKNVGACPKHYIANDSETERFTLNAVVDETTLRELYLKPFEIAATQSKPWMIMSSYNSVNGHSMSESPLLTEPLKGEWGFDGVVVSDWTAVRTVESAGSGQDLAMPGPLTPWNQGLKSAIEAGQIAESIIDDKVERILRLAERVGKLSNEVIREPLPMAKRLAVALEVAERGMVLLKNDGILPLSTNQSVALSGDSAARPRFQGGGSAQVLTKPVESPLEQLQGAFSSISYSLGAELISGCTTFPLDKITNPKTGTRGARVEFFDESGKSIRSEDREGTFFIWEAESGFAPDRLEVEFDLDLSAVSTADFAIGAATVNPVQLFVDGQSLYQRDHGLVCHDIAEAILQPPTEGTKFALNGRKTVGIKVVVQRPGIAEAQGMASLMVGEIARNDDPAALIAEAALKAAQAEVALVVVGTNSAVESEGFDRTTISLPGHQDELVYAVAKANPNTVVVVNSGAPVDMPWRNEVSAILVSWFGGQKMGEALKNVLTGEAEPAGRLPTSWVMKSESEPLSTTPTNGVLKYSEGLNIGYRRLNSRIEFPIGFGLGYGNWSILGATSAKEAEAIRITVQLNNKSQRLSRGFVAVFCSKAQSIYPRPNSWLLGWGRTEPSAGEQKLEIEIPLSNFASYQDGWKVETGEYQLEVVSHFGAEPIKLKVVI